MPQKIPPNAPPADPFGSRFVRNVGKLLIMAFVLWHAFAVFTYAIPDPANDSVSQFARSSIRPIIQPYIFTVSQWQQWNLFSPDPLRRITRYSLEMFSGNRWGGITEITNDSVGHFRTADELTIIRKLEEMDQQSILPILSRYFGSYCAAFHLPPNANIQLRYNFTVMPSGLEGDTHWWNTWQPAWQTATAPMMHCPQATAPIAPIFLP